MNNNSNSNNLKQKETIGIQCNKLSACMSGVGACMSGAAALILSAAAVTTAYYSSDIYNGILKIQSQSDNITTAVKELKIVTKDIQLSVKDIKHRYNVLAKDQVLMILNNKDLDLNQAISNYNQTKSPLMPYINKDMLLNNIDELKNTDDPTVKQNLIMDSLEFK